MPYPTVDTSELDQLRHGGNDAFAALFARYRDRLLRMVALRLDERVVGKVDADDVVQDAFLQSSRRIDDYVANPAVPLLVWLRQITAQVLIDTHRRFLGAKMRDVKLEVTLHPLGSEGSRSGFLAIQLADSLTTPSQFAVREETLGELRTALEQLDDIDREVLVLRHLEELSNNEVAQILGIDKFAASKRYLRALVRLRGVMPVCD